MPADAPAPAEGGFLSRKLGPLPLWAIIAGGAGVALFLRSRKQASQNVAGSSLTGTTDSTGATLSAIPGTMTTNGGTLASGAGDNNSWANQAVAFLEARGMDPLQAAAAIQAYLNGYPLSAQQQGLVDVALGGVGNAPQPIAPIQLTAPPPVPSGNPGPVWPPSAPLTPAPPAPSSTAPWQQAGGFSPAPIGSVANPIYAPEGTAPPGTIIGETFTPASPGGYSGSGWTRSLGYLFGQRPAA